MKLDIYVKSAASAALWWAECAQSDVDGVDKWAKFDLGSGDGCRFLDCFIGVDATQRCFDVNCEFVYIS